MDGPFVFEARVYVAVRKLGRLEVVGGERVDELVEFLLLRLIVRVGLVLEGARAVHNVVLNIDGGVYAHGKSECIAWARIDCVLFAILIENDDVGEENRGFHVGNLNASDFGAKLFNGIDGEIVCDRSSGVLPVNSLAQRSGLEGPSLDGEGAKRGFV